jgi:hypothetical protein
VVAPGMFFRYLLPVAPLLTLLLAVWLFRYVGNLAVVTVLVLILSAYNGFAMLSGMPTPIFSHTVRWPLANFIRCITTPYHDRTERVVAFLKQAALPEQTLMVEDPEFALQFYLPLRILDCHLPMKPAQPLPDWILSESASGGPDLPPWYLSGEMLKRYEPITLRVPHSAHGGGLPFSDTYEFFTAKDDYDLVIYKKKPETAGRASTSP